METKKEKFKRLATKRLNSSLKQLDLLENCSNKNNYEYDEESVNTILKALNRKIRSIKSSFTRNFNRDISL